MDKKNTLIGVSLLLLAIFYMYKTAPVPQPEPAPAPSEAPTDSTTPPSPSATPPNQPFPSAPLPAPGPVSGHAQIELDGERGDEIISSLENPLVEVLFTNYGGAVKEIVLKDFKATLDSEEPYAMNHLRYAPALNLSTYLGDGKNVIYEKIPTSDRDSIAFRGRISDQLEVTRRYTISQEVEGPATYTIRHELEFRNLSDQPLPMGQPQLNLGTVAPSGSQDRFLQTFGYSTGEDVEFVEQSDFLGGGFLMFSSEPKDFDEGSGNIVWASVKNQFFITLITPDEPVAGYIARPVDFPGDETTKGQPKTGLTADIKLQAFSIPPNGTYTQSFDFYAGPKEHKRLSKLDKGQEQAMQFGFFGWISKFLLLVMNGLFTFVGNWGLAIILLTLVVRGALLPITLVSMRSMKKMSKLGEPMKKLKELFPDNQQKQQTLMMELYKLNKVNPVAGCLPMLLQIPVFFGLFYMLRSAAELRFADFLWISDLSKPDTVATLPNMPLLGDFPINLLPFVWLVTLAYQMWTMPAPSVDNAQVKMMKFMPFIFFPFTYTFSSGLVLYWTVSNVFTIGQQWLVQRGGDDFEVQLPPALKKAIEGAEKGKGKRRKK